jgi:hypothetical protein
MSRSAMLTLRRGYWAMRLSILVADGSFKLRSDAAEPDREEF